MKRVDYDERLHSVYAKGRALSRESIDRWLEAFASFLPGERPLRLVDVGCGAGRFTPHLAERFGGPVIGVEPSTKMLEIAITEAAHPSVTYLTGTAEATTCEDSDAEAALLFFVWHHVVDRIAAARELRRITRPGATLLIRTQLADQMPELWWYDHSPRAKEIDTAMYQTLAELCADLGEGGWELTGQSKVAYEVTPTRRAYVDRLRLRAISTFEHLTDVEADDLIRRLEDAVVTDPGPPVDEHGTLLAFQRGA